MTASRCFCPHLCNVQPYEASLGDLVELLLYSQKMAPINLSNANHIWIMSLNDNRRQERCPKESRLRGTILGLFPPIGDRSCTPHSLLYYHFVWMEQRKARDSLSVRLLIFSLSFVMADKKIV